VLRAHVVRYRRERWQVMRLLIAGQDGFVTEARDILRAGLANAA
jgi:hypothetical protein